MNFRTYPKLIGTIGNGLSTCRHVRKGKPANIWNFPDPAKAGPTLGVTAVVVVGRQCSLVLDIFMIDEKFGVTKEMRSYIILEILLSLRPR